MTRPTWLASLAAAAILSATLCVLTLTNRAILRDAKQPDGVVPGAKWLTSHPAHWRTATAISDAALDVPSPNRVALWRAAYAHAKYLAPPLTMPNEAFVRAGVFHWYELDGTSRAAVLDAAAPLMKSPPFFERMHVPFWQLTTNFSWLRRVAPETPAARDSLRALALSRGLFDQYRILREDFRRATFRAFETASQQPDPAALLNLLPTQLDQADEPLVKGFLTELDQRSFDAEQMSVRLDPLVTYALSHDIQPLTAIVPFLGSRTPLLRDVTRARAAVELNDPALATRIELTAAVAESPEWDPYYLDRARFEARRRKASLAEAYIARASLGGVTVPILAAAEEVATILGRNAQPFHAKLIAQAQAPHVWSGTCAANELCSTATTSAYILDGTLSLNLSVLQSDEIPPYVEILVDDTRIAEGEIRGERTFRLRVAPGLREVTVRLVNNRTRNGIQRRVRLS